MKLNQREFFLDHQALKAYDELNFKKVASLSQSFMNSQISGFYLHVIRDRCVDCCTNGRCDGIIQ